MKNKKIKNKQFHFLILLMVPCFITSCSKKWLEEKPNKEIIIPSTLSDLQGMLDMNIINGNNPYSGEAASGDHYTTEARWTSTFTEFEKNVYSWTHTYAITSTVAGNWNLPYTRILYTNVVLDRLKEITPASSAEQEIWNQVQAQALFHRAKIFFALSEVYAPPYDPATAATDLDIPLRTNPDVTIPSVRSTVKQKYDMVIGDLMTSINSLPDEPLYTSRASKPAAYAILSRVYLSMRQYDSAFKYADKCLQIKSDLLEYSTLNTAAAAIGSNKEIIFHDIFQLSSAVRFIDTTLYSTYEDNDLRKLCFFKKNPDGTLSFKGNYNTYNGSTSNQFCGVATDEMYLTRAEGYARKGNTALAMIDLNDLLRTRWKKIDGVTTYVDQTADNADDALAIILMERRKELLFRNFRWSDLRRLNKEDRFKVTLTRIIGGKTYTLEPNSYKYAQPIPDYILQEASIKQNPGWE